MLAREYGWSASDMEQLTEDQIVYLQTMINKRRMMSR